MTIWTESKLNFIEKSLSRGKTLQQLADRYAVSRQRMYQVVKSYLPHVNIRDGFLSQRRVKVEERERKIVQRRIDRCGRPTHEHPTVFSRLCSRLIISVRRSAKARGLKATIRQKDLEFPTYCPVLGIKLDYSGGTRKENSPSFDRIDNNLGYVVGNVIVVSWRANRIRNNGFWEEHLRIAKFYKKYNQ